MSNNAMTISASNDAFFDLSFGLSNTFCITDIKKFLATYMVKMQSGWIRIIATVYTASPNLVGIKPSTNNSSSLVSNPIDMFTLFRVSEVFFNVFSVIFFSLNRIFEGHTCIIAYPCKPDIFEATYEPIS